MPVRYILRDIIKEKIIFCDRKDYSMTFSKVAFILGAGGGVMVKGVGTSEMGFCSVVERLNSTLKIAPASKNLYPGKWW